MVVENAHEQQAGSCSAQTSDPRSQDTDLLLDCFVPLLPYLRITNLLSQSAELYLHLLLMQSSATAGHVAASCPDAACFTSPGTVVCCLRPNAIYMAEF
jgi:hypothetical protein